MNNHTLNMFFDISSIDGFEELFLKDFKLIRENGMEAALKEIKDSF